MTDTDRVLGLLYTLPDSGWGVTEAHPLVMVQALSAGLIKVQMTSRAGVYQARVTGRGRALLRAHERREEERCQTTSS